MVFALGTTSSAWDVLRSLTTQSGTPVQTTVSSFELTGDAAPPESTPTPCSSCSCSSPLSSQTLGALIAAQGRSANSANIDPTGGTSSSALSASADGSTDTGGTSTDPQGQIAGASPTVVTNADGSTTTSLTLADGAKITLVTPPPLPQGTSNPRPPDFANFSFGQIEQLIQSEAQSLSAFAFPSFSVNA
jgi:hypothetical protein